MKTKYWMILFALVIGLCGASMVLFAPAGESGFAEIYSGGELVTTVSLARDQELDIGGHNTVTVQDGKIAVTWADCPDHYCMERGFCSGGRDIVCLPNRLVITFVGEQELDGISG